MSGVSITAVDLQPFAEIPTAKATAMIADALAMAKLVAPCISEEDFEHADAAKAVIRGAILRWHEAGQGGVASQTALGFGQSYDNRMPRRAMFWPSEIDQLQKMCRDTNSSGAWSYDTIGTRIMHGETCSVVFGAAYCDCGAVLTGSGPLWEV